VDQPARNRPAALPRIRHLAQRLPDVSAVGHHERRRMPGPRELRTFTPDTAAYGRPTADGRTADQSAGANLLITARRAAGMARSPLLPMIVNDGPETIRYALRQGETFSARLCQGLDDPTTIVAGMEGSRAPRGLGNLRVPGTAHKSDGSGPAIPPDRPFHGKRGSARARGTALPVPGRSQPTVAKDSKTRVTGHPGNRRSGVRVSVTCLDARNPE